VNPRDCSQSVTKTFATGSHCRSYRGFKDGIVAESGATRIIGPNAPASHSTPEGEGVTLNIPGVINFNHTVHGDNVFIRTS